MAGVFEGDVKKNLLERTEAEKVFRPWWDTLEDYLLNILIIIGGTKRDRQSGPILPGTGVGWKNVLILVSA